MMTTARDGLVPDVLRALRQDPHRVALVEGRRRHLAGDLADRIEDTAARLATAGVGEGSVVAFAARPGALALVGLLALHHRGATAALLDPVAGRGVVEARLALARPELVLASAEVHLAAGIGAPLARRKGIDLPRIDQVAPRAFTLGRRLPGTPPDLPSPAPHSTPATGERDALVVFTSGTTASPKAVVHTEASLRAGWDKLAVLTDVQRGQTVFAGEFFAFVPSLLHGATVVLPARRASAVARQLRELRPETIYLTPPQLRAVLDASAPLSGRVFTGSAPVTARLLERARTAGADQAWSVYALTEIMPVAAVEARDKSAWARAGDEGDLAGTLVEGVDARVDDAGQLLLAGPNAAPRYLGEEPTGHVATGDLARLDDGRVVLLGRGKDMILRGAENIYPGLYEPALHVEGVAAAVMVGIADADLDERVVVCVEREPGYGIPAVRRSLAPVLARMGGARPDAVVFLDELPRGGRSAKPDRAAIATEAARRLDAKARRT